MLTKKYKIKGVDCPACAINLECDLECVCTSAKYDYAKDVLEVRFEKEEQEKKIMEIIYKAGLEIQGL